MITVTGMHRSGTSCVTGLLVRCGFSLGTSHPLFNEPRFDNAKGHFENRGAMAINETIIRSAGGQWHRPPSPEQIERLGECFAPEFRRFGETFNGTVFKDPRTSLTMSLWRKYCPNLEAVILCLRNPVGVASSLKRRDGIPVEAGLKLWYEYNLRLIRGLGDLPVIVVDYDNLEGNLELELMLLLSELGQPVSAEEVRHCIDGFYSSELNHDVSTEHHLHLLPPDIRKLYEILQSQTFTGRTKSPADSAAIPA